MILILKINRGEKNNNDNRSACVCVRASERAFRIRVLDCLPTITTTTRNWHVISPSVVMCLRNGTSFVVVIVANVTAAAAEAPAIFHLYCKTESTSSTFSLVSVCLAGGLCVLARNVRNAFVFRYKLIVCAPGFHTEWKIIQMTHEHYNGIQWKTDINFRSARHNCIKMPSALLCERETRVVVTSHCQ